MFVHSPVSGHLGYFHFGSVANNLAVNMGAQVSGFFLAFISSVCVSRSGISGPNGNSVVNLLRNRILHVFVNSCHLLVLFWFGILQQAILMDVTLPQICRHLFASELLCDKKPWELGPGLLLAKDGSLHEM